MSEPLHAAYTDRNQVTWLHDEDDLYVSDDDWAGVVLPLPVVEKIHGPLTPMPADPATSGNVSDGSHTFNELDESRMVYQAALFTEWARTGTVPVVKTWTHDDGQPCYGGSWFLVVADLPGIGQVSNHYPAEHWDAFAAVPEGTPAPFDGHTSADTLTRMRDWIAREVTAGAAS